jgi:catechol 2,3-dioxygenase-like lactoylglutathione lyase family enzyme
MKRTDLAIPILPSLSLSRTLSFYARLGFSGKVLGEGDAYAIVTRGEIEIHFFLHPELRPAESIAGCYIKVADVEAMYESLCTARLPTEGIPRLLPPEDKPWGMRELAVVDEDGNLLRVGQVLEPSV